MAEPYKSKFRPGGTSRSSNTEMWRLLRKMAEMRETKEIAQKTLINRDKVEAYRAPELIDTMYRQQYDLNEVTRDTSFDSNIGGISLSSNDQSKSAVEASEPGIISKLARQYNKYTRPYAAVAYWGALEARKKLTGNDQGVAEMRNYIKARKRHVGIKDRALSPSYLTNPLTEKEEEALENIWKRNTLPWGVLGVIELVVDPINLLPVAFIAKSTGRLGVNAFKAGTRLVLRKGTTQSDEIAQLSEPLFNGQSSLDIAKDMGLVDSGLEDPIRDFYKQANSTAVLADVPYANPAEYSESLLDRVKGRLPNILKTMTIGTKAGSVIQPTDTHGALRVMRDATFANFGRRGRAWERQLAGLERLAWDLDGAGNIRNVRFNQQRALVVLEDLNKQAKNLTGEALEEITFGQRYIQQMIDKSKGGKTLFHHANVIENYDMFDYLNYDGSIAVKGSKEAQDLYVQKWREMQNEVVGPDSIMKRYLDPEDLPLMKVPYTQTFYKSQIDGKSITGGYFPHLGIERWNADMQKWDKFVGVDTPVTRQLKGVAYEPFFDRQTQSLIEEGIKTFGKGSTKYTHSPTFAAVSAYQALGGATADLLYRKEYVKYMGQIGDADKIKKSIADLWLTNTDTRGRQLKRTLADVPEAIKTAPIKLFDRPADELHQDILKTTEELGLIAQLSDFVKAAQGRVLLKEAGLIRGSARLPQRISQKERDRIRQVYANLPKQQEIERAKLREMRKALSERTESVHLKRAKGEGTVVKTRTAGVMQRVESDKIPYAQYATMLKREIADQQRLVDYNEHILAIRKSIDGYDLSKQLEYRLPSIGKSGEPGMKPPTIEDALMKLEKAYPGSGVDTLRKKDLLLESPALQRLRTFADTKKGELQQMRQQQKAAAKNRAASHELKLPDGGWVDFGSATARQALEEGLLLAPEATKLPTVTQLIYDANRTMRVSQTGFDAGGAMINGLRLLTTPGGAGPFRKMFLGLFADIMQGKTDLNSHMARQMATESPYMFNAKSRSGITNEAMAEQVEIFNSDAFLGLPGRDMIISAAGKIARVTDESIPEGSTKGFLRRVKNAPLAAIKAYTLASNFLVNEMYENLYRTVPDHVAKKMGVKNISQIPAERMEEAKEIWRKAEIELGDFANKSAGKLTANAGGGLSKFTLDHNVAASFLLFAPRFLASQISLTLDMMRGNLRGRLARESTQRLLGAATLFYIGTAALLQQEPKIDPRPKNKGGDGGDFMSLEIDGMRVSVAGSANSMIKQLTMLYGQLRKGTLTKEQLISTTRQDNEFIQFMFNRTSPIIGTSFELLSGRTYSGRDIDWGDGLLANSAEFSKQVSADLLPFWAQSMRDMDNQSMSSRAMGVAFEFSGMSSYASSPWNMVSELRNQSTDDMFGEEFFEINGYRPIWDDMDDFQQAQIESRYPEILEAENAAAELWGDRAFNDTQAAINDYVEEVDIYKEEFDNKFAESVNVAVKIIMEGKGPFDQFDQAWRQNRSLLYKQKSDNIKRVREQYPEVMSFFEEQRAEELNIPLFNVAYQEYLHALVYNPDLEIHDLEGGYDFRASQLLREQFISRWGNDIHGQILQLFELNHASQHFIEREYRWGRQSEAVQQYWAAPYAVLDHYGLGMLRSTWDEYETKKRLGNPIVRNEAAVMAEEIPELKMVDRQKDLVRKQMRAQDADLEHFLFKYGYISSFENPLNEERNQLGVPLALQPLNYLMPSWLKQAINTAQLDTEQ